jgi:hypothetical protein
MDSAQVDKIDRECFTCPLTACSAVTQRNGIGGAGDRADVIATEKPRLGVPYFGPVEGIEMVICNKALDIGGGILEAVNTTGDAGGAFAATTWFTDACVGMSLYKYGLEYMKFLLESFENFEFLS